MSQPQPQLQPQPETQTPLPPRQTRSQTRALAAPAVFYVLPTPVLPRAPKRFVHFRPGAFADAEDEEDFADYVFEQFVTPDAKGKKRDLVPMDDIPDFDLGEALFPDEDLQTHHTVQGARGFTNYVPVRREARGGEEKKKKRRRAAVGGGCLKRRRAFRKGGRERGVGGRFIKGEVGGEVVEVVDVEEWEGEEERRARWRKCWKDGGRRRGRAGGGDVEEVAETGEATVADGGVIE